MSTDGWMPRARSRSSPSPPSSCSRARARAARAAAGSRSKWLSSIVSSRAAATRCCCAPSWRSRSIRRLASSAASTRRAREAAISSRASAFSIAYATSSANAATRSSAPTGISAASDHTAATAPQTRPLRRIGPAAPERMPRLCMSAATPPPASSQSSIRTGRGSRIIRPRTPCPSMGARCPTGTGWSVPSDQLAATIPSSGLSTRTSCARRAPSSVPTSLATASNTSAGEGSRATSVATRRNAACSRTSSSSDASEPGPSTARL